MFLARSAWRIGTDAVTLPIRSITSCSLAATAAVTLSI